MRIYDAMLKQDAQKAAKRPPVTETLRQAVTELAEKRNAVTKPGRPRKYGSDADRQAAYRARKGLAIAKELKRKRDAGQEVPGTEWLREWTDKTLGLLSNLG